MSKIISNNLRYHYDEELFNNRWKSEIDQTSLVLLESGAVVNDAEIENMIAGGGNYYTIPFYKDLTGNVQDYDGATTIVSTDTEDGVQSGFVYGEAKGFLDTIFVRDFTGADPMGNIVARIAKFWNKQKQKRLLSVLEGIFAITGDNDWDLHTTNIATSGSTVTDANRMGATTLREASVKALGEHADNLSIAIMHSAVALRLSNLQVLEYYKYVSTGKGLELDVRVARCGNLICLIWDGVPVSASASATGENEYTTYILGNGAILTADAPVERPSDLIYDAKTNGGQEELITRMRKTYHPNGFSFSMTNLPISPSISDAQTGANWSRQMKAENINIVRVITN